MTITVNGPGGVTVNFPEGTDGDTINRVMVQATGGGGSEGPGGGEMGPKLSEMSKPGRGESVLRGGMQGATFNFSDELQAALGIPVASVLKGETGKAYDERVAQIRNRELAAQESNPGTYLAGELGGSLVVPIPGAGMVKGAATLGGKALRSAAVGAGAGAAYGVGSGEGIADSADKALTGALTGGVVGAALPPLAKGAGFIVNKAVGEPARRIMGNFTPEQQAARKVSEALEKDQAAGRGLTEPEWLAAKAAGDPVILADRGGTNTQALMRASTNASPEAHALLKAPIEERWVTQTQRVADDLSNMGPNVHAQARLDKLKDQAAKANAPRYQKAYEAGDRDLWSQDLQDIANTSLGRKALQSAVTRSRDYDIALGTRSNVRANHVEFDPDLGLVFQKDKSRAYPNLQIWDYTKRELDQMAQSGDRIAGKLATRLREELDKHVPEYLNARGEAAKFFGAKDAVEFGKMAAQRRALSDKEILYSIRKMTPPERQLFRDTFRAEFGEVVKGVRHSQDIAKTIYGSEKMQKRLRVALGPQDAKKLESRLYIESAMDEARQALGNSTSVRQLAELGLVSGTSGVATAVATGDVRDLGYGALAGAGLRHVVRKGDRKVAERVAELLASSDPKKLQLLANQAANSPKYMETLREIAKNLTLRGSADAAAEKGGAGQLIGFKPVAASDNPQEQRKQPGQAQDQDNSGKLLAQGSAAINALQRKMRGPEPPSRPIAMGIRG